MLTCAAMLQGVQSIGLSAVQTGMDNVRNMTGSPIAGIDPHELLDVRPLNHGAQSSALPKTLSSMCCSCFDKAYMPDHVVHRMSPA